MVGQSCRALSISISISIYGYIDKRNIILEDGMALGLKTRTSGIYAACLSE